MNTKAKGDISEAHVIVALLEVYPTVLMPFGDNQRYDLVFVDHDEQFVKVQCKTGRYRKGSIQFNTCSMGTDRKAGERRGYQGEVDYFGVYCPDFSSVYLVPIADANGKATCSLRIDPSAGHRTKWAKDYLIYDACK